MIGEIISAVAEQKNYSDYLHQIVIVKKESGYSKN